MNTSFRGLSRKYTMRDVPARSCPLFFDPTVESAPEHGITPKRSVTLDPFEMAPWAEHVDDIAGVRRWRGRRGRTGICGMQSRNGVADLSYIGEILGTSVKCTSNFDNIERDCC